MKIFIEFDTIPFSRFYSDYEVEEKKADLIKIFPVLKHKGVSVSIMTEEDTDE